MQVSSVNSIASASTTSSSSSSSSTSASASASLTATDFLTLLIQQYENQDPMDPVDSSESMAQLAQISSLQLTSGMSDTLTAMQSSQNIAAANSYIGKTVTITDSDGNTTSGEVTAVKISDGSPLLVVGDSTYNFSDVTLVEPTS